MYATDSRTWFDIVFTNRKNLLLNHSLFSISGYVMKSCCFISRLSIATDETPLSSHIVLDNVKIGNLRRKNRDHKKVPKQDEDAGNLQILLHSRSLF